MRDGGGDSCGDDDDDNAQQNGTARGSGFRGGGEGHGDIAVVMASSL